MFLKAACQDLQSLSFSCCFSFRCIPRESMRLVLRTVCWVRTTQWLCTDGWMGVRTRGRTLMGLPLAPRKGTSVLLGSLGIRTRAVEEGRTWLG